MVRDDDQILLKEAEFANRAYAPYKDDLAMNENIFRHYAYPKGCWDWRDLVGYLLGDIKNKSLLDFGCGMGEEAVYFAKLGASVTAIDVSEVGIEVTKMRARFNNLFEKINPIIMRADNTQFSDNTFDIVHGLGILHHIGIKSGLLEVKRILKSSGKGIFFEPIGNCFLIEQVKSFLMGGKDRVDVTESEKPLTYNEIKSCYSDFKSFKIFPYHLTFRIKRYFPESVHDAMKKFDYSVLKTLPFMSYFGGAVVIYLEK